MRSLISLLVVGATILAGVAFVVMRPQVLGGVLPSTAVSALSDIGQSLLPTEATDKTPDARLVDAAEGLLAIGAIAAHDGNRPVDIDAALTGHRTRVAGDIPAEITTIRPILGCMPTPPQPGTVVGHATSGQSGMALALSTYNDRHLAAGVQAFVDQYRSLDPEALVAGNGPAFEAYDVAVTETQAPVYLVLENRSGIRIWNLHLAPGARIERVVLLGGDQAGVANLDPVIPVEVILDNGLAACGVRPAYPLNPGHHLVQVAQGVVYDPVLPRREAEARLRANDVAADAYDIWFRDSFGVTAGESRVGFDVGSVSIIGPMPAGAAPKALYNTIAGARIRTTKDQFFEIRGQVAQGQDFAARVRAIASDFAGGDLTTLLQGVSF